MGSDEKTVEKGLFLIFWIKGPHYNYIRVTFTGARKNRVYQKKSKLIKTIFFVLGCWFVPYSRIGSESLNLCSSYWGFTLAIKTYMVWNVSNTLNTTFLLADHPQWSCERGYEGHKRRSQGQVWGGSLHSARSRKEGGQWGQPAPQIGAGQQVNKHLGNIHMLQTQCCQGCFTITVVHWLGKTVLKWNHCLKTYGKEELDVCSEVGVSIKEGLLPTRLPHLLIYAFMLQINYPSSQDLSLCMKDCFQHSRSSQSSSIQTESKHGENVVCILL